MHQSSGVLFVKPNLLQQHVFHVTVNIESSRYKDTFTRNVDQGVEN